MVARHDEQGIAPGGDVIKAFLPDGPALILMDELLNYISRERQRKSGQSDQLYHFLQNLSEEAHGCSNVVLCVSIPASELEMTPEDHRDYEAIKKLLDRLGKAVIMSTETEIAEIIRRRLFDWGGLPDDAKITASSYAKWVIEHKQMVGDFDVDSAHDRFLASYPFHPALLSVFERKWRVCIALVRGFSSVTRVCSRSSMLFLYMIWPARPKVAVIFPELSFFQNNSSPWSDKPYNRYRRPAPAVADARFVARTHEQALAPLLKRAKGAAHFLARR